MRASRLVSILLLLQARRRMTAWQLAETLEVSVRTIYRDVQALHAAGVPLYGDPGADGGYRLVEGYRTRLTGLNADEAKTLFLAGVPGAAAELGLGTVLATARLKLQAALPAEVADGAARIGERFFLDAPGWYYEPDSSPHLAAVADAVWHERRIRVRYRRWRAPTDVTRTLDPYGIVLKAGTWYLVARPCGRDSGPAELRTYRVSQILRLTVLEEHFERAPGFDLPRYWRSAVIRFRAGLARAEATIRLSPEARQRMREVMSSSVITAADQTASEPDERGWITAVVPIESLTHAHAEFLRLGADVEILDPGELRSRFRDTAREFQRLYLGASDRV